MSTNITALYGIGGAGGCKWKSQTFTTSETWIRPAEVEVVKIVLVGGGGSKTTGGTSSFGNLAYARGGRGYGESGSFRGVPQGNIGPRTFFYGGAGGGFPGIPYQSDTYDIYGFLSIVSILPQAFPQGAPGVANPFGISGGGGGSSYGSGGSVPGLGSGGGYSLAQNSTTASGGGGGSYGNGGNGGSLNSDPTAGTLGGGGGGAIGYGGGGGGEIIIREVAVSDNVFVTIGAGAPAAFSASIFNIPSKLTHAAGGNGLCIVYWIE